MPDRRHAMICELPVVPAISPGTYVRLRRQERGLSVHDVALMIETDPGVSVGRRAEWLEMIETDAEAISLRVALVLQDAIAIDLRILAYWTAIAEGATPSRPAELAAASPANAE